MCGAAVAIRSAVTCSITGRTPGTACTSTGPIAGRAGMYFIRRQEAERIAIPGDQRGPARPKNRNPSCGDRRCPAAAGMAMLVRGSVPPAFRGMIVNKPRRMMEVAKIRARYETNYFAGRKAGMPEV